MTVERSKRRSLLALTFIARLKFYLKNPNVFSTRKVRRAWTQSTLGCAQFHFLKSTWSTLLHIQDLSALSIEKATFVVVSSQRWAWAIKISSINNATKPWQTLKITCEILQREATRVRQEQESIDSMSKKLHCVHFSSTVKLNVGGEHFTTSVQTLTKDPNSMSSKVGSSVP